MKKIAIIIGAGPAGLTAASELLKDTDYTPLIFEMTHEIGGISKTVNYKGNRIDIGGHRFFSKSTRIMSWWKNVLPLQGEPAWDDKKLNRKIPLSKGSMAPDPEKNDEVMLTRSRLSRIFFMRKFFDYPISLKWSTFQNLGLPKVVKIGFSYARWSLFPSRNENSLEDFLVNRFGKELYRLFFKDYTQKVWGVPCNEIKPEWGAQRIKGLSITKAILHALRKRTYSSASLDQKNTETSLIEQFMYPKLGPGQLWEKVADDVKTKGGQIVFGKKAVGLKWSGNRVYSVQVRDISTGKIEDHPCNALFSTMPVCELISAMGDEVPETVKQVAQGLCYRDFLTVGLLLKKMKITNKTSIPSVNNIVPDNWIYIQERDVKVGRVQIFNNWSPYMVKDRDTIWIGLEYFCKEGDELWVKNDESLKEFASKEMVKIGLIEKSEVLDSTVIRVPKAYPAYFGSYEDFGTIRDFTDLIGNMFLIGRNGMHRYNNADHSMLTAINAVECLALGILDKTSIWQVNTEDDYHEEQQDSSQRQSENSSNTIVQPR
jgi:protoporphyrinogen oxidase